MVTLKDKRGGFQQQSGNITTQQDISNITPRNGPSKMNRKTKKQRARKEHLPDIECKTLASLAVLVQPKCVLDALLCPPSTKSHDISSRYVCTYSTKHFVCNVAKLFQHMQLFCHASWRIHVFISTSRHLSAKVSYSSFHLMLHLLHLAN